MLPHSDQRKVDLLLNDADKKLFLLSRMLLSKFTCQYFACDYSHLKIKYNQYGKPLTDRFYFNISHSYEYATIVCSHHRVGIDIEKIRNVDLSMVDYFCSHLEKEYVLNSQDINKAFFTIYCLKEAFFKMIGTSILNFKEVEFTICNNTISCSQNSHLNIFTHFNIDGYIIIIIEEKY